MTKRELRELIRSVLKEYTGTGHGKGNSTDGNNVTSQRDAGGSFTTDEKEKAFYTDRGAPYGGAEGQQTRGMEKSRMGNPNSQKQVRF